MKLFKSIIWSYCLSLCLPFLHLSAQLTYEDPNIGSFAYKLVVNEKDEVYVGGLRLEAPEYKTVPFISRFNAQLELMEEHTFSFTIDSYIEQTTLDILPNNELLFSTVYWEAQENLWHWKWIKLDEDLNEIEEGGKVFDTGSVTYVSHFSLSLAENERFCIWRINESNESYWEVYFLDENLNKKDNWLFLDFDGYEVTSVASLVKDNFGDGFIMIANSFEDNNFVSPVFRIHNQDEVEILEVLPLRINKIAQGPQSKWYMIGSQKSNQNASNTEAMLLIYQKDMVNLANYKFASTDKNLKSFNNILITKNQRIFVSGTDGYGGGEGPVSSVTLTEFDEFGIVQGEAMQNFSGEGDIVYDLKEDANSKHIISCGVANSSDVIGIENYFVWSEPIPITTTVDPEIIIRPIMAKTNPFHNELELSFSKEHDVEWSIVDINGRQYFSSPSFNGISIDTHSWPTGIYLMQFKGEPNLTIKLLKQ